MHRDKPEPERRTDLSVPPDLRHQRRTGPDRSQRPIYLDLLPPCNHACPAGENIQGWLALAQQGMFREAWDVLVRDNPFPAIHGRVCYHPCEDQCNRIHLDEPVSIHAVERFLGDMALEEDWRVGVDRPSSGKRVLVIGAGPCGLSAAYHLALFGHEVEIRDAGPVAGGMLQFGIPAYRLPRNILSGEIDRIEEMGVRIVLDHKVEDLARAMHSSGFDAVLVAVGAHLGKRTEIPARDAGKMLEAVSFLRDVELGHPPILGRQVAVYGGGNTAMDAARVALRLGSEPLIIYRRDRQHMPAHESEADEALTEGVKIHWLRTIKSIEGSTFTVERMRINDKGRPEPTGEFEVLQADDLILALGQDTDTDLLKNVPGIEFEDDGTVRVNQTMMTGCPGVFAGGDMVHADRTVTIAVGHGKRVARNIDAYLHGETYSKVPASGLANFEKLRPWFYGATQAASQDEIKMWQRRASFAEVRKGLGAIDAVREAKRCLSCGNCFECDGCYGACPEDAIIKLGPGLKYEFDYDRCTGCATCFEQCPSHAISMEAEP